ncbi:MAG TPA: DctP family TRAP transporter solute-binding subunit [Polyangiaceae bacterium]|jgi:tripartite ATP-independent transporter DctP family solute receptor|nr:DctP family TRAP transporter solute-binding subunit [Polyangiaceae bacterium]
MSRPARRSILALGALLPALGLARGAAAHGKLKWAHVYETSEPFHRAAVWASDQLRERSAGAIDIQVFPASSLGKESDLNQGLRLGTIEIVTGGVAFPARRYPRLGISYYPYLFRDAAHLLAYGRSEVFAEIAEGFRAATGVALVSYAYYGTRHVSSQRPFGDCAGMAGLKIRVPDVAAYSVTPLACGANPTPIAFAELYLALQNNTVEAQENPLTTILAKKLFEVQKHIMLTGHVVDGLTTMVAPHVWAELTPAQRELVIEVARQAAAQASDEIRAREAQLVDEFVQKGLEVHAVDRESFRRAIGAATSVTSLGYEQRDYDRITAIRS